LRESREEYIVALKVLQVGAGGWAGRWCSEFLPANVRDGTIEVVGLADTNLSNLAAGKVALSLADTQCFTDPAEAFARTKADFCTVVVPPAHHEAIVNLAVAHELHILSEKPIADTMEGSVRIARKVTAAGLKFAVTFSHRFDQDKHSLERIASSGELGTINSLFCHVSADMRRFGTWGGLWGAPFRHKMDDPLLIEGSVHHFDILKGLAGARCSHVYANTWRPQWADYAGNTDANVVMQFENGVRAIYYGSVSSPVGVPDWWHERVRVEGSAGIANLNHREIELFKRMEAAPLGRQRGREGFGQKIPLADGRKWQHALMIENFAKWLQGGPAMETHLASSLETDAMVFAAIESSRTGQAIDMNAFRARYGVD
jgi:predicted dehydrogenase